MCWVDMFVVVLRIVFGVVCWMVMEKVNVELFVLMYGVFV